MNMCLRKSRSNAQITPKSAAAANHTHKYAFYIDFLIIRYKLSSFNWIWEKKILYQMLGIGNYCRRVRDTQRQWE